MISKLQIHCGPIPLMKINKMRNDMEISVDLFEKFKNNNNSKPYNINLDVKVLSAGSWPASIKPLNLNYPKLMENAIKQFKSF